MPINVLKIAKQHYTAQMTAPVGTIAVPEWMADGVPVVLSVYRLNSTESQAVATARKDWKERGQIVMTIIHSCYLVDGETKKRAFQETDFKDLMERVSPAVLERIYSEIIALLGEGNAG